MSKGYRTTPADRGLAERCARAVFGEDVLAYEWANGFETAARRAAGTVEYWLQTECDRSWVTYYARAELGTKIEGTEDRECLRIALDLEALLDSCYAAIVL